MALPLVCNCVGARLCVGASSELPAWPKTHWWTDGWMHRGKCAGVAAGPSLHPTFYPSVTSLLPLDGCVKCMRACMADGAGEQFTFSSLLSSQCRTAELTQTHAHVRSHSRTTKYAAVTQRKSEKKVTTTACVVRSSTTSAAGTGREGGKTGSGRSSCPWQVLAVRLCTGWLLFPAGDSWGWP